MMAFSSKKQLHVIVSTELLRGSTASSQIIKGSVTLKMLGTTALDFVTVLMGDLLLIFQGVMHYGSIKLV